jgi:hypothetical protein
MELLFGEWSLRVHQPRKKLLGRGFDGLPLVVFGECSDATVAADFLGFVATRACCDVRVESC